jgi:hypothetical protein
MLDDYIQGKTYKVMLSTDAIVEADDNISDLTEIAAGSGYSAGGPTVAVTCFQDSRDAYLVAAQPTISASGGDIGPYTGIVIYEVAGGNIVGAYNEEAAFTIEDGSSRTIQFNQIRGFLHCGDVEAS